VASHSMTVPPADAHGHTARVHVTGVQVGGWDVTATLNGRVVASRHLRSPTSVTAPIHSESIGANTGSNPPTVSPVASGVRDARILVASHTADDEWVPFYLEPGLGGHNTLRSFSEYRFHDRNGATRSPVDSVSASPSRAPSFATPRFSSSTSGPRRSIRSRRSWSFRGLSRLLEGMTSITIAHRLAPVRRADVIFVLNDGVISERGTHYELLALNGLYAHLYRMQFEMKDAVEPVAHDEDVAQPMLSV